ncbi:hypothetical protein HYS10_02330 [Candidatus Collierbacteria bacterium]|nr:hypothetical protein [Candidatus Collierbacteria bacterium]
MKKFDFQTELKRIIDSRQLVEVNLHGAPTYLVAYILSANDKYLTFAVVSSSATLTGVTICHMVDVDSISIETIYLSELAKQISDDSIYQQALKDVQNIKEFTFDGFASGLENTKTLVEITTDNDDNISGRIAGHSDDILILDEYSSESDRRIRRTYFNRETIVRISLDVAWIRTISRSLDDKNI